MVRERESRESAGRVRNDPWKIYFYVACDVDVADAGVRDTTPKLNQETDTYEHTHTNTNSCPTAAAAAANGEKECVCEIVRHLKINTRCHLMFDLALGLWLAHLGEAPTGRRGPLRKYANGIFVLVCVMREYAC